MENGQLNKILFYWKMLNKMVKNGHSSSQNLEIVKHNTWLKIGLIHW